MTKSNSETEPLTEFVLDLDVEKLLTPEQVVEIAEALKPLARRVFEIMGTPVPKQKLEYAEWLHAETLVLVGMSVAEVLLAQSLMARHEDLVPRDDRRAEENFLAVNRAVTAYVGKVFHHAES